MQANANSSTVRKEWLCNDLAGRPTLFLSVGKAGYLPTLMAAIDITGASPAYVEELIEELNIRANEMLYNLGRIPRE